MHQHDHSHSHAHSSVANLKFAFLLNLSFTVIEIAGGLWTNSVAILSDAVHDFGDSFSLALAWYLHYLSQRVADARFTYGYRRFSSLGGARHRRGAHRWAGLCRQRSDRTAAQSRRRLRAWRHSARGHWRAVQRSGGMAHATEFR